MTTLTQDQKDAILGIIADSSAAIVAVMSAPVVSATRKLQIAEQAGFSLGMNFASGSFGDRPGKLYTNYTYSPASDYTLWAAQKVTHIRHAFLLERLFPSFVSGSSVGGAMNTAEAAQLTGALDLAKANGQKLLLDAHNYFNFTVGGTAYDFGSTQVPMAALVDMWKQIVTLTKAHPALYGYGLMNEPITTHTIWATAAQACINAIRVIDPITAIMVAGSSWSSAALWPTVNPLFPLTGDNIVYEAHMYVDGDASGTFANAAEVIDPQIGVTRLTAFYTWLKANRAQGIIGESGCPPDRPGALLAQANAVAYCKSVGMRMFYWAAGQWWPASSTTAIEVNGAIRAQWAAIQPSAITLTQDGPLS